MSRIIRKGATSQTIYLEILDSTSSTGGRKTGLVYNTGSLTAYYVRNGGSATSITLATLASANSAWSSGGFKEVDSSSMPGVYRLDVPDAALASGADSVVITLKGATGMVQVSVEIQLAGVPIDLTMAVPTSNTAETVGDALNAARAQGFGKWGISGTTLTLYANDGTTAVRTFTLDSATTPTSRT